MRGFLVGLGLVAALGGAGFYYFQSHPEQVPVGSELEKLLRMPEQTKAMIDQAVQRVLPGDDPKRGNSRSSARTVEPQPLAAPAPEASRSPESAKPLARVSQTTPVETNQVTLYLTNGGIITGELVRETAQEVVLRFDYGEVGFQRREIKQLAKGQQGTDEDGLVMPWENEHATVRWDYQYDIVVKLMKGTVVDGAITEVTPQTVTISQVLKGGGVIEHTIQRKDIDQLLFKPITNERSQRIEENLKTLFPHMQWHEEGMFTIVTDSIPPTVKGYRRTVRELATDFYLTFYPLLKDRALSTQQYVVIFDDFWSFIEYAISDGVPGWAVLGYFSPQSKVLYLFNAMGERFSDLLYEAFLGSVRRAVDGAVDSVKGQIDSRYAVFIEGQGSEIKKKFETTYASLRQSYVDETMRTLRHELTHALFHNWGVQTIILSTMSEEDKEQAKKKREFLQSSDLEEKRRLLMELLTQKSKESLPQMQAANSWFVEGLASYLEGSPVGRPSEEWLSVAQEAQRNNQILPLEFLNAFKMGSFPRMAHQAKGYAYGQSWAMCHFLMQRYPAPFLAYLDRMAREQPKKGEDLDWLLASVGKELRPLEQEFLAHLAQFPPEDPPWLKEEQLFLDLRESLRSW